VELTLALAREMLALAGIRADPAVALRDGSALERYRAMVVAQGGDPDAPLPRAAHVEIVTADRSASSGGSMPGRSGPQRGASGPEGHARRIP